LLAGVKLGRKYLTKGVCEDVDSGQQTAPGSLQAAGLDQPRRGIEPTAHPCLGIEESLEAPDLQRPIRQASAGQHRDGVAATHAQEALDAEALASGRFAEAPIEAMTVEPPRTPSRAVRPIPFEAVSTDLDALLRTPLSPTHQARLSARTRDLLTPPRKKRQPSTPTRNPGPPQ
jgi:hypothetical protein